MEEERMSRWREGQIRLEGLTEMTMPEGTDRRGEAFRLNYKFMLVVAMCATQAN